MTSATTQLNLHTKGDTKQQTSEDTNLRGVWLLLVYYAEVT